MTNLTKQEFKNLRKSLGLTQRQMAKAIGVKNYRTVQRYETRELPIQGAVLRVCQYIERYGLL